MIGLVLGDTHIGELIVKKLKSLKINFIIIDISKRKLFKKNKKSYQLSIGQLGKCISILKSNRCKKLIFAGRVDRPNFSNTKFDFKAIYHLPKIIKETKKGDAYIIKFITNLFIKEGFKIISQTFFNTELVLRKGNHTKTKPNIENKTDIIIGKKIINNLKNKNVSQGIVVIKKKVIISEDFKGTDAMLTKAQKIVKKIYSRKKRSGILLKLPKPNQDMRTDLPTVGLKTIKKCVKIGLRGIVVKSKYNIFIDKSKCINLANKNNIFIYAI
tara:strand:+ start:1892 stop:2704 length:813 start_codon:yes stop_codon:yes gene_type:complete